MINISKSDRGKNILEKTLSSVALLGYGQGGNWIGCCRKRGNISLKLMKKIVNSFCSHFSQGFEHCFVVSSLIRDCYFPIDYEKKYIVFAKSIEKKLVKKSLLRLDLEHNGIESLSRLESFEAYSDPESDTIQELSYTLMINSRVFGHLFFVFEKFNTIAYPHDETGFGFIAINGKAQSIDPKVSDFLQEVGSMVDFESIYQASFSTQPNKTSE